jgi:hypothetical protein
MVPKMPEFVDRTKTKSLNVQINGKTIEQDDMIVLFSYQPEASLQKTVLLL